MEFLSSEIFGPCFGGQLHQEHVAGNWRVPEDLDKSLETGENRRIPDILKTGIC
jgi:hypothetical protein